MRRALLVGASLALMAPGLAAGQGQVNVPGTERPEAVDRLKSDDVDVRGRAADALYDLAADSRKSIQDLRAEYGKTRFPVNRALVVRRMGRVTAAAYYAIPPLSKVKARDEKQRVGGAAARALDEMKRLADEGVGAIRQALRDEDFACRMESAKALGGLGPLAADAVQDLEAATRDREPRVRQAASAALGRVRAVQAPGADEARGVSSARALIANLEDRQTAVRVQAAEALGIVCKGNAAAARIAVPELGRCLLADYDTGVRRKAAEALGVIGPLAADALPSLRRAVQVNRDQTVVNAADQAIREIEK